MKKKELRGVVSKGKIVWNDLIELGKTISSFEGKEIKVTIEKFIAKRSIPQNAYFHVAHLPIIHDELVNRYGWDNWSIEQTKAMLRDMYLRIEITPGKFYTRSTTELDRLQFSVFLEQCSLFAWHEFQVTIPPASIYKIDMNAEYVRMAA